MAKKLLSPDDVRSAVRRSYQLHHRGWLAGEGAWPLVVALGKPTERDVIADAALMRGWVEAWRAFPEPAWVRWLEMQWPKLGCQHVPSHVEVPSALAAAALADDEERFERARARHAQCLAAWPALARTAVLARAFDVLADYADADFIRLVQLVSWLLAHPRSGCALRQLPVPGLDTKWIDGKRKTLAAEWLAALRGEPAAAGFYEVCGLKPPPVRLRMRVLCPALREALAGLCDVEAPLEELARLPLAPSRVLVVENLESGLALPDLPGCVAFVRLGNAVTLLSQLGWLAGRPVSYWGDIDTHGFAILDRARASLGDVSSVLMDEGTLLGCRELWGQEPVQCTPSELPHLTASERAVFDGLRAQRWGQRVRLEQERIPWGRVVAALALG